jgi:uncharacterized damage-inducible protein DinB
MRTSELRFLLEYDAWATARVLAASERLSTDAFGAAAGAGHVALRDTVLHCVDGMRTWRERLQGTPLTATVTDGSATLAEVRALWQAEHARLEAYVAGLADGDLDAALEQRRPDRVLIAERWQFVVHLVLHNMQHRSELAQALTLLGRSPGEIGLTAFIQQRSNQR